MGTNGSKNMVAQSQYSRLIWLDASIKQKNDSYSFEIIAQFRRLSPRVQPFNNHRQCLELIKSIENEKVCLVVSGALGQVMVSQVHDLEQIQAIVIFCADKETHEPWAKQWPKILGVFTDIDSICQMPPPRTESCSSSNNQLDRSFVYTEILKDILLSIDFNDKTIQSLEEKYHDRTAIDWYTSKDSLRAMLDRALKTMELDPMLKLGFFIKDLHHQIKEQSDHHLLTEPFTVYYGQNVSANEFEEIRKNLHGFLSFNHFLLTTKNQKTAQQLLAEKNSIRIMFEMLINPSKVTTPFVLLKDEQILFSTHTLFRIDEVKSPDKTQHFFQVKLALTDARDKELSVLGDELRGEIDSQSNGWIRLGCFLIKLAKFEQAQPIVEELLSQNLTTTEKASIDIQLRNIFNKSLSRFD